MNQSHIQDALVRILSDRVVAAGKKLRSAFCRRLRRSHAKDQTKTTFILPPGAQANTAQRNPATIFDEAIRLIAAVLGAYGGPGLSALHQAPNQANVPVTMGQTMSQAPSTNPHLVSQNTLVQQAYVQTLLCQLNNNRHSQMPMSNAMNAQVQHMQLPSPGQMSQPLQNPFLTATVGSNAMTTLNHQRSLHGPGQAGPSIVSNISNATIEGEHKAKRRKREEETEDLPRILAIPEDIDNLSAHQIFLRYQIEAFRATKEEVSTHTRGRNKPVAIGQIGIRCRHCSHLPVRRRQKGSTYFPATLLGLYQAAQNMCTIHMQCGLCSEMPLEIKQQFAQLLSTKVAGSGAGRPYWASTAMGHGLVDTDDGIRFSGDVKQRIPDEKKTPEGKGERR